MVFKKFEKMAIRIFLMVYITIGCFAFNLNAQNKMNINQILTTKQQCIVQIAALTARGELQVLKPVLNKGLDAGLTVNEIKEVIVHLYAYCGFPRSIRGLQTFMEVLDERKAKGIKDKPGAEASSINQEKTKYERGKKVLGELTKAPQDGPLSGYSAFAPVIDTFLKEHLFADTFERDVLTYAERELVTISVLSSIGGVEPMLRSHLNICLNVGLTPAQLNEFVQIIKSTIGEKEAKNAQLVLNEVLKTYNN
jgi:alkylhydroperoxidase/carboxymuconolactone decarboxylase family protein YurZ